MKPSLGLRAWFEKHGKQLGYLIQVLLFSPFLWGITRACEAGVLSPRQAFDAYFKIGAGIVIVNIVGAIMDGIAEAYQEKEEE